MTHAEKELERLKEAFEKWSKEHAAVASRSPYRVAIFVATLFWPFVAHALNDMQGSAEKSAMINRFKKALGMELMAHERFGVGDE